MPKWMAGMVGRLDTARGWVERHPRRAWFAAYLLVFLVVLPEIARYPLNNFPGAIWHHEDPGIEIRVIFEQAPKVTWADMLGYWAGRPIHGNDFFLPLTSWIFVGQYRLFGENNAAWACVNLTLHTAVVAAMVWAAGVFAGGGLLRRLAIGSLAAILFASPLTADREVQSWALGWWPCQPDLITLLGALVMLAGVVIHVRTGSRRWAYLALLLFPLGVCFKEMMYVGGLGACLLLVRQPRRWGLLAAFAGTGLALFAYRSWLFGDAAARPQPFNAASAFLRVWPGPLPQTLDLSMLAWFLAPAAAAGAVFFALPRAWKLRDRAGVLLALYLVLACAVLGPPWESPYVESAGTLAGMGLTALVFWGLALAFRAWPAPELLGIYLISSLIVAGEPLALAWHHYWSTAFGSILAAFAAAAIARRYLGRARKGDPEAAGTSGAQPQQPSGAAACPIQ
jgi:hypothetical protein